ncbi:MAG: hypothetical protein KAJ05_09480 [Candidatus Latescibacteria bacterium]|nr:hypothetical protein [Candidatus Latescibacterota bacterium]
MQDFKLSTAKTSTKLLVTVFLLTMGLGYLMAMVNVGVQAGFTYQSVSEHMIGNEEEMIYPKEFASLVGTSHTHLFGHPPMFLLLGAIFLLTSVSEKFKKILLPIPFIAVVLDMGSLWLTRYVAPGFAYLTIFSGMVMGLSFFVLFVIPLYEMWLKKVD